MRFKILLFLTSLKLTLLSQISFTNGIGQIYSEDFNSLSNTTSASLLPAGWFISETGTNANATYGIDNGTLTSGNTYSYGVSAGSDRALGELTSGSLTSTFGAAFLNNTDSFLVKFNISYYTELWRKGVTGVLDSMIFEYSTDATSLTTGTWFPISKLNAKTPNVSASVGLNNGDLSVNRILVSDSIVGISLAPGAVIWIKWRAVNIGGNDDGLAIDDLNISVVKGAQVIVPASISIIGTQNSVLESTGSAIFYLKINGANGLPASIDVTASVRSTANANTDYTLTSNTYTFPSSALNNDSIPVGITIIDDAVLEADEYIFFSLSNGVNSNPFGTNQYYLYIRDNDLISPAENQELNINLLTSFSNGSSGTNSAEIVSYDSLSKRLFIANSLNARLDIVDFSNPSNPILLDTIDISSYGNINSVATFNGIVAVAIENINPQDSGKVLFLDTAGTFISSVKVGMMPDMITFNHAGTKVVTANEGEPNNNYTIDPDGSISVIDISTGINTLQQTNVTHIQFLSFNGSEASLRSQGIRIYGLNASASKDFEPEYITISDDDTKAWVSLQENNAIAEIDLLTNSIIRLIPLGYKNHQLNQNGMDVSDVTSAINICNWPVKGMYLPDAITHYTVGNSTYLISANEGDSRAYAGFNEESRVSALTLDPLKFPNAGELKNNLALGRLNATKSTGDSDGDGDIDSIYVYGSRSFSIWDATNGSQVYDSGSEFERITANHPIYSSFFNASNGTSNAIKNRSDDKGPEPEGVVTAAINGTQYAFVALERIGGMMVYNIQNPVQPHFVKYVNNRSQDRGAEGIVFISANQSPTGKAIVILANEISSSLSIYEIESCVSTLDLGINSSSNGFCPGDSVLIQNNINMNVSYQWLQNGAVLTSDSLPQLTVNQAGDYSLIVSKGEGCTDTSNVINIAAFPLPNVLINPSDSAKLCVGDSLLISVNSQTGNSYLWQFNGVTLSQDTSSSIFVSNPGQYNVIISTINSCSDTSSNFNLFNYPLTSVPIISLNFDTLTASFGTTFQWYLNGNILPGDTNQELIVTQNGNYSVTISDINGCSASSAPFVFASTGISSVHSDFDIMLLPNPTSSSSILLVTSEVKSQVAIKVLAVNGEEVYNNESINIFPGKNELVLPFENMDPGMYFIVYKCGQKMKTLKALRIGK